MAAQSDRAFLNSLNSGEDTDLTFKNNTAQTSYGLKTLHPAQSDFSASQQHGLKAVDIVAVHGLAGHPLRTWTHDSSGKLWLRDFLPNDLPGARVMTYGYKSSLINSKSVTDVLEKAENLLSELRFRRLSTEEKERPIIFVGHSIGGLLIKNALSIANRKEKYNLILQSTCGVVLMGVPHDGADIAKLAKRISRIVQVVTDLGTVNIKDLIQDSRQIQATVRDFGFLEGFTVITTNESEKTSIPRSNRKSTLVVPPTSTKLNLGDREKTLNIVGDHRSLPKFPSADDVYYQKLVLILQDLVGRGTLPQVLSEREKNCLQYFLTSNYVAHRKRIPNRGPGTCQWFLKQEVFINWLSGEESVALWVSGPMGCGKTILSSYIIDEFNTVGFRSSVPSTTCYFFCDTKNSKANTGEAILQAMLHQIFTAHPFLLKKHALPYYQSMGSRIYLSFATLCDIFEKVCFDIDMGNLYCVIDGFDECEKSSRKQLIRLFKRIIETKRTRDSHVVQFLKILMVGRPEETIHSSFHGLKYGYTIQLDKSIEEINEDITEVVHAEIGKLKHLWSERNDMRAVIESTLIARAHGSFLWASLVLEILREPPESAENDIDKVLEGIPGTLEGVYENIIAAIPARRQNIAKRILIYLVCAARPLLLSEIALALAIEPDDGALVPVIRKVSADIGKHLRLHCGPLIKIAGGTAQLVHRSAVDFLQDPLSFKPETFVFHVDSVNSNYLIATACVRYISMLRPADVFEESDGAARNNQSPQMKSEAALTQSSGSAFVLYAATYWAYHVRQMGIINDSSLLELVQALCDEKMPFRLKWLKLCSPDSSSTSLRMAESWRTNPQTLPTINILARFGLVSVVQELLRAQRLDILLQDIHGYTGLHWAAHEGHEDMVEFLLQNGADPKLQDRDGYTALHTAAFSGQESIVNLILLSKGPEIEMQSNAGWTPLHVAAYVGSETIVKLLIRSGANAEATDKCQRSPLHIAAFAGHLPIVGMLLENGCYRQARDLEGETALHYASRLGRDPVIKGLIQDKNDRKSKAKLGRTALHVAAEAGRDSSILVLLQKRLEIEARDDDFRTALHVAAQAGNDSVVQALLDSKCERSPRDAMGMTPLHLAADAGNDSTVEILIRGGADYEVRDNQERTPMRLACSRGYVSIIRTLLDYGCHGDSLDGQEQTSMHIAAGLGHDYILEALLQKGCQKIDFRDQKGLTPLHVATYAGHEAAMEVLLHYGCDADARDNLGETPLHFVARSGNDTAVKLLAEGGCDRHARDSKGRTALHIASHEGRDPIIKTLLSDDYEKEAQDEFGWTALHLAVLAGHHATIGTLLKNGCNGSTRSSDGDTALHMAAKGADGTAIKELLEKGGDMEENIKRITVHVASQVVHDFSIRVLLENGCHSNTKDRKGWTALHHVAGEGRDHSIRALLEHGADPNIKTEDTGRTALHHATAGGHLSSVKLLCENGADPKVTDKKGVNVLEYATSEKKVDIAEYLKTIIPDDDVESIDESVAHTEGHTECSHDDASRIPEPSATIGHITESQIDDSVVTSMDDSHDNITIRTPALSTADVPVESTESSWPPPPTVTDRVTSSVNDSSDSNTTYQRHEDETGATTTTEGGLMGLSDIDSATVPVANRRKVVSSSESIKSPAYTDMSAHRSPPNSTHRGSIGGNHGFSSPSQRQKAKQSRWPAWCLCGKEGKGEDEEAIPARLSPSMR